MPPVVGFSLLGCQPTNDQAAEAPSGQTADSPYTEGNAMSIYRTNPERAIVLIDSGVAVGSITPGRGKYLKAVTQYGGYEDLSLARQLCYLGDSPNIRTLSIVCYSMFSYFCTRFPITTITNNLKLIPFRQP